MMSVMMTTGMVTAMAIVAVCNIELVESDVSGVDSDVEIKSVVSGD